MSNIARSRIVVRFKCILRFLLVIVVIVQCLYSSRVGTHGFGCMSYAGIVARLKSQRPRVAHVLEMHFWAFWLLCNATLLTVSKSSSELSMERPTMACTRSLIPVIRFRVILRPKRQSLGGPFGVMSVHKRCPT